jgi:hypothetical protein
MPSIDLPNTTITPKENIYSNDSKLSFKLRVCLVRQVVSVTSENHSISAQLSELLEFFLPPLFPSPIPHQQHHPSSYGTDFNALKRPIAADNEPETAHPTSGRF